MPQREPVQILVWDNGSCQAFRKWLVNEFQPDFVMLSANIGKWSARKAILEMLPGETIVNISDDDMLYYPGWLEAQLELLEGFPKVGAVSCWPGRTGYPSSKSTVAWAKENAEIELGRFIPDEWEWDYATSLGMDPVQYERRTRQAADIRISFRGLQAYGTAQHCQFMCYAGLIAPLAQYSNQATDSEHPFDHAIDEAGLLRLTTIERFCRHMGNSIDDQLADELETMDLWRELA